MLEALSTLTSEHSHAKKTVSDYKKYAGELETFFREKGEYYENSLDPDEGLNFKDLDPNHLIHFLETREMKYLDGEWGRDDMQNLSKYRSACWYFRSSEPLDPAQDLRH